MANIQKNLTLLIETIRHSISHIGPNIFKRSKGVD